MTDLSIIVVSYNTKKLTVECIKSVIEHTKEINYEILVIDNASSDESVKELKRLAAQKKLIKLIRNKKNLGFSKANNQGIKSASGKYLLFLNSDTLVTDNILGSMVKWVDDNPEVGIVSCSLKYKDGSLQGTGGYFPTLIRVFSWMLIQDFPLVDKFIKPFHPMKEKSIKKANSFYQEEKELDWVTGAFMFTRRKVVDQIKGFDEEYFMYTEEVDLCYRAKQKGWKVWYKPQWSILHYGGASGTGENAVLNEFKGIKLFYKKNYSPWKYPVLRAILKIGSLGRILLFGLIEGKSAAKVYAKAFRLA